MAATAVFPPGFRLTDASGEPISGARIEFLQPGSGVAYEVFAESDLQVTLGSIVYTDSEGYPVTTQGGSTRTLVYVGTDPYRVVIYDADDVVIADHDNCVGAPLSGGGGGGGGDGGITQAQADVRYVRNPNALTAVTTIAETHLLPFWHATDGANRAIRFDNFVEAATSRQRTQGYVFSPGTRMLFAMSAAPTGWTKVTTYHNYALRLVNGTGAGTGGSVAFTTAFASKTVSGSVGDHTLAVARIPAHSHNYVRVNAGPYGASGGGSISDNQSTVATTTTGGGDSHSHSFTGNAIDLSVQYLDLILCEKS